MRNWLFVFVLFLPSVCFGQAFNIVLSSGNQYPYPANGQSIPLNENQAILRYVSHPSNTSDGLGIQVLSVSIIPTYVGNNDTLYSAFGWYTIDNDNDTRVNYSVVDNANIYVRSTTANQFLIRVLPQIQNLLVNKNLGTVEQRAAFIAGFKAKPPQILNPGDILGIFTGMLGPWAYALVGLWIALIGLDVGTRSMTKTAGQAAKEQRKAERAAINYEKSHDYMAQLYEKKLKSQARFIYGPPGARDPSVSISDVRRQFRETAREYADYQRERGWIR